MPFANFPVNRLALTARAAQRGQLPEYAGSMLRGAWGHALRSIVCSTGAKSCEGCPWRNACEYPRLFEPPPVKGHAPQSFRRPPAGYVIEPPPWGERPLQPGEEFSFSIVLAGHALAQTPLAIRAFATALERGLGARHWVSQLLRVDCVDSQTTLYTKEAGWLAKPPGIVELPGAEDTRCLRLRLMTPLRLKTDNALVGPRELTARDLLMALVRRVSLVSEFNCGVRLPVDFRDLDARAAAIEIEKRLAWQDWERYSTQQATTMMFGGLLGEITLRGALAPFMPFLHVGRWLHVGKQTTFGLGRFDIVPSDTDAGGQ